MCINLMFPLIQIFYKLPCCNKVADCLAFHGAHVLSSGSEVFMNQVPDYVKDIVLGDLPNIV